jgi:hypothetical protein
MEVFLPQILPSSHILNYLHQPQSLKSDKCLEISVMPPPTILTLLRQNINRYLSAFPTIATNPFVGLIAIYSPIPICDTDFWEKRLR